MEDWNVVVTAQEHGFKPACAFLEAFGLGPRNQSNLAYFLEQPDLKCVAVCDCFAERRLYEFKLAASEILSLYASRILCSASFIEILGCHPNCL